MQHTVLQRVPLTDGTVRVYVNAPTHQRRPFVNRSYGFENINFAKATPRSGRAGNLFVSIYFIGSCFTSIFLSIFVSIEIDMCSLYPQPASIPQTESGGGGVAYFRISLSGGLQ